MHQWVENEQGSTGRGSVDGGVGAKASPVQKQTLRVADPKIVLRSVNVEQVAHAVRRWLDLPIGDTAAGARVARYRRVQGSLIFLQEVDANGWLAWMVAGAYLFSGGMPSMAAVRHEAKRVAVTLAMFRSGGSISKAATMLGISRKVLRDNLRAVGLYPWVR